MINNKTPTPLRGNNSPLNPQALDKGLNPAQQKAVFFDEGPLLLIAGAGSGKTKTIVHRVARLIHDGIPPESILLLTFTRKSANEMLTRASRLLDSRCHRVSGGTFHSFSNITLRQYSEAIGYRPHFTIMDRGDSEDLIQWLRKEKGLGHTEKRFPKKKTIASIISKSINTTSAISDIIAKDYPQFIDFRSDINHLSIAYQNQKQVMNVMDYDDLLVKMVTLLTTHPQIRSQIQAQYQYIMVDEYQDTNAIQATIIDHLINDDQNIMVVGDDCQSIYSFRGADHRNIMDFPHQYPKARVITLTENYRSTQPILDLTNAMISYAREKFTKALVASKSGLEARPGSHHQKPIYVDVSTENMQSRFICQKILELRENRVELNDITVLMRSGWHANDLELELSSRGIPFVKVGGLKFVESAHVNDVISLLKIIANPTDQLSWQRILILFDGLGAVGALRLIQEILATIGAPDRFPMTRYQGKKFYADFKLLFHLVFTQFRDRDTPFSSPSLVLDAVLLFYRPLFKLTYDDYSKRESDIDSLETIASRFKDLQSFLTELSLEPPTASRSGQIERSHYNEMDDEKITLSTIHSAKGLEWDTVFMMSCVDGYIPSFQSLGERDQIEEERRLLYVALTRAKNNLFIVKPHLDLSQSNYYRYSGVQFSKLSRFLSDEESLSHFIEQWTLDDDTLLPVKDDQCEDDTTNAQDAPDTSRRKYSF